VSIMHLIPQTNQNILPLTLGPLASPCRLLVDAASTSAVSASAVSTLSVVHHIALCLLCFLVFFFSSSRQSTSLFQHPSLRYPQPDSIPVQRRPIPHLHPPPCLSF
jgi:hypothetical protein